MRKFRRRTISQMIDDNKREISSDNDNVLKKLEDRLEKQSTKIELDYEDRLLK